MQPCSCWMFGVRCFEACKAKPWQCHKRSDWQTNHAPCWPKQMEHQYKFMSLVFYDTKAQKQWILSYASQSIVASVYVFGCRRHSQKWTQMWSVQIVTKTWASGVQHTHTWEEEKPTEKITFMRNIQIHFFVFQKLFPRITFMTWIFYLHISVPLSVCIQWEIYISERYFSRSL